ncbi:MAG: Crp/Fnr family transcriptional regulator [Desertimonas sp.]
MTARAFADLLGADERGVLIRAGQRRHHPVRAMLLAEGDDGHQVLVIRTGYVKVVASMRGHEVVLDVLGPGDLLGEVAAIDDGPRSASAIALSSVEVVAIPGPSFVAVLDGHPSIERSLRLHLARRLREASHRQVEYGALDAIGRVAARLVELTDRFGVLDGDRWTLTAPLTQADLAGWAGLSREATVKALRTMRQRHWVETGQRAIVIRDLGAIREVAAVRG